MTARELAAMLVVLVLAGAVVLFAVLPRDPADAEVGPAAFPNCAVADAAGVTEVPTSHPRWGPNLDRCTP